MFTLENKQLKITVKKTGAELCKITSSRNGTEFMWDANPDIWGSYAPNLFPIIGALKNDTYIFENQEYKLPKHGIVRNNEAVVFNAVEFEHARPVKKFLDNEFITMIYFRFTKKEDK